MGRSTRRHDRDKNKFKRIYDYSDAAIAKRRTFPKGKTVLLIVLVVAQIGCVLGMIFYQPQPQDRIEDYSIYVTPKEDGTLDIEYRFSWTALDTSEPLTWVEIGMANPSFSIYEDFSDTIRSIENSSDDYGYSYTKIYFMNEYIGGETVDFSFKVNQRSMLCEKDGRLFYEFIPGWFNRIPVSHYSFNWRNSNDVSSSNADIVTDEWLSWKGTMGAGEYRKLNVNYSRMSGTPTFYREFDDSEAYNGLKGDKMGACAMMGLLIAILLVVEIVIVDCYVSYNRGRGFLRGYGHPVHIYGRSNPHYTAERDKHAAASGRGRGGGGGCACACACACAGGGRAGCSQKDTYKAEKQEK
ncbi:MAG: hypothetical protein IJY08_03705 [Clostridia bacterium]|nr:hypothetical protein [Clostridia bacterium]